MDVKRWLLNELGYIHTIQIKDSTLFVFGILVGALIMAVVATSLLHGTSKAKDLGNVTALKFKVDGKKHYYLNSDSFLQTFEFIIAATFLPILFRNGYTVKDVKRTKVFIYVLIMLFILLLIVSTDFVLNPLLE